MVYICFVHYIYPEVGIGNWELVGYGFGLGEKKRGGLRMAAPYIQKGQY